jgi:hypothetical protein
MPHVQVVGPCRIRDLSAPLSRIVESYSSGVLKVQGACLDTEATHLILEAIVVEGYLRHSFFLLVRQETDGVLVRCHPFCAPQKTDGVKRLIALVARRCLALCPGSRVGNTNLTPYLS